MRYRLTLIILFLLPARLYTPLYAQSPPRSSISGDCSQGGKQVTTASLKSLERVQLSYPTCSVTVHVSGSSGVQSGTYLKGGAITGTAAQTCTVTFTNGGGSGATATVPLTGVNTISTSTPFTITSNGLNYTSAPTTATLTDGTATCSGAISVSTSIGTNKATLYLDDAGSVLANPFTSDSNGHYMFFADNGHYDITLSGSTIPTPFTLSNNTLLDDRYLASSTATARTITSKLAEVCSVKDYGAVGDDTMDDKPAIDRALAACVRVYFPHSTYRYHGKMTEIYTSAAVNGRSLSGDSSSASVIHFTDSTVTAGVEVSGMDLMANVHVTGLTFKGPGKLAGTAIHGFYVHNTYDGSYNWVFNDVAFTDWSGNGAYVITVFQQKWFDCWARSIHGNGFELGGDQSVTFVGGGDWMYDIDGWCWWIYNGNPFLQNLNAGTSSTTEIANGAKFGRAPTHPLGAAYCNPTIIGMNIEGPKDGGIGLWFEEGSNIALGSGIQVYALPGRTILYGAYWVYMGNHGLLLNPIQFIPIATGTFTNYMYLNGANNTYSGLTIMGANQDAQMNASMQLYTVGMRPVNGTVQFDRPIQNATIIATTALKSQKSGAGETAISTTESVGATGAAIVDIKSDAFSPGAFFRYVQGTDVAGNAHWGVGQIGGAENTVTLAYGTSLTQAIGCSASGCIVAKGLGVGAAAPLHGIRPEFVFFTTLASLSPGDMVFCSDCQKTSPCTNGGTGAFAFVGTSQADCH